jgi:hypothetical protein
MSDVKRRGGYCSVMITVSFFYLSISDPDRGIKESLSPGLMVTLF